MQVGTDSLSSRCAGCFWVLPERSWFMFAVVLTVSVTNREVRIMAVEVLGSASDVVGCGRAELRQSDAPGTKGATNETYLVPGSLLTCIQLHLYSYDYSSTR